jgi:hypothetical protein
MDEPTWSLSQHATNTADDVYYQRLEAINISAYGDGVLTEPGDKPLVADREDRELYADSLFDLHRLLEEIRFEIAFATMLTSDYRAHHPIDEPSTTVPKGIDMTLSIELLAVLSTEAPLPPSPSQLTTALHREILGHRHLSRWLAAQLLDSAILRCLSSLDRVATMLHIRADLPIERRADGSPRPPGFSIAELKAMRASYEGHPSWQALRDVARHDMYKFIKGYRDGTVHHRRWPSELHGEASLSYSDAGASTDEAYPPERRYEGLSAQNHIGLTLGTWNHVLRPAIETGGLLVARGS